METPLPALIGDMSDPMAQWAEDAELQPCLRYARYSKFLEIPEEFKGVI